MALGDPYATATELASYLSTTTTADGTLLTLACASASTEIEQLCGRQFNKTDTATARTFNAADQVTITGWPTTRYGLYVDDFHSETGLAVTDGDTALVVADLTLLPSGGVMNGMTGWPYTQIVSESSYAGGEVTVTVKWGWAAVPSPIKEACLILAAETFKQKDAPFGVAGVGEFGVVRTRENPRVDKLLGPYRIRSFVA